VGADPAQPGSDPAPARPGGMAGTLQEGLAMTTLPLLLPLLLAMAGAAYLGFLHALLRAAARPAPSPEPLAAARQRR